jgi:hypothetical protein
MPKPKKKKKIKNPPILITPGQNQNRERKMENIREKDNID